MVEPPKVLFVFVDGLGLGAADPRRNPLLSGACPFLAGLLERTAIPLDATLGVPGLPQSATGQAALLTGVNAARLMGRHVEGFPGPRLKALVREHNIFSRLRDRGYTATFANAYYLRDLTEVQKRRRQSVTTVAALAAFGQVRDAAMMLNGDAVYQDLTRRLLRDRGYTGPFITPRTAARHLMRIAVRHHFTLFEYFLTDIFAHKGDANDVRRVLRELDQFLERAAVFARKPGHYFILTSDHGNLEDSATTRHTLNPVPFVALGFNARAPFRRLRSIADVAPAILRLFPKRDS